MKTDRDVGSLLLAGMAAAVTARRAGGRVHRRLPAPAKKAMFWKVSSGDKVAWLLGSIHVGSKSMYPLPKEIEDAFERSRRCCVEIDHQSRRTCGKCRCWSFKPACIGGDETLWDHVSPETRQRLEAFCEKYGLPADGNVENEALGGSHDGIDVTVDEERYGD